MVKMALDRLESRSVNGQIQWIWTRHSKKRTLEVI